MLETWKLERDLTCTKKKQKYSLPNYVRFKNNILRSPQEIANNFNKYFAEIGPDLASKTSTSSSKKQKKSNLNAFQLIYLFQN